MVILSADFWTFVGVIAGIYTIFALGVQFGLAGLLNFGQAAFMAVAGYAMAITVVRYGVPLAVGAVIGVAAAILFGVLLGIPTLRLRADYLAMATIAAAEIVRYLALNLESLTGGPIGTVQLLGPGNVASYNGDWEAFIEGIRTRVADVVGADLATRDFAMLVVVWACALGLLTAVWLMARSPWGRVLRSIREDEEAAAASGKNVFAYKLQAFALGAALGGFSGLLLAWEITVFSPDDFKPTLTFFAYIIVIIGGMTRVWAVPVGAIIFGILFAGTRSLDFAPLSYFDSGERAFLRLVIVGVLLIALMALRPQGILGNRRELLLDR